MLVIDYMHVSVSQVFPDTHNEQESVCVKVVSWLQDVVGHLLHGTDVFAHLLIDGSNQLLHALILDSIRNVPLAGN